MPDPVTANGLDLYCSDPQNGYGKANVIAENFSVAPGYSFKFGRLVPRNCGCKFSPACGEIEHSAIENGICSSGGFKSLEVV